MGIVSIPVRLSLVEGSAVALLEAADNLATAGDAFQFVAALDVNRRLWLTLSDVAEHNGWPVPDAKTTDSVMTATRYAGRGTWTDSAGVLAAMNRETSRALAAGRDLDAVRARAMLAWKENGEPRGFRLDHWLIAEIERKGRLAAVS